MIETAKLTNEELDKLYCVLKQKTEGKYCIDKHETFKKILFNTCDEPNVGDIVFTPTKDRKALIPVEIISGQYLDPHYHRLSNFWEWKNLCTGDIERGYGEFYEIALNLDGDPVMPKERIREKCKKVIEERAFFFPQELEKYKRIIEEKGGL